MYTWINETGEMVKTKTIVDFAQKYGFRLSNARSLACGHFQTLHGWTTTNPKARKRRQRMTTVLVNTETGERKTLGRSVTGFARSNGLSIGRLSRLINGSRIQYKSWVLASTLELAQAAAPDVDS